MQKFKLTYVQRITQKNSTRYKFKKERGNVVLEVTNLSKYRERYYWVGQLAQPHTQFAKQISSSWGCSSVNGHFACC